MTQAMSFREQVGRRISAQERRRLRLRAARTRRLLVIVAGSVTAGVAAVLFAKLADLAQDQHAHLVAMWKGWAVLLLPLGLPAAVWATRRFAPEAAGSGIPQIIAAAEGQKVMETRRDPRLAPRTALIKVLVCAGLLLCGASIGREGPTVQVTAAVVYAFGAWLYGGPGRRALLIAGGAAGVAAAFNAPIAGVVFAVEELAKGFDRRSNSVVILVVVAAGVAAYALSGNYAYFGELRGTVALGSAWYTAPIVGVACGAFGGLFSRFLAQMIGPRPGRLGRWKAARPMAFAAGCGGVAAVAALLSRGLSYGAGYAETASLLAGHPGRGLTLAVFKFLASLAAAGSGAPGGIFSPSLATGAGVGAFLGHVLPFASGRDTIVLGMAAYLSGVVQAPLTSAIILMEMTRDPGLVGPLMLATLIAREVSSRIMPEPIYHALSHTWRLRRPRPSNTTPPVDAVGVALHTPRV
jgi:H+/Cl- antiporter ClcA